MINVGQWHKEKSRIRKRLDPHKLKYSKIEAAIWTQGADGGTLRMQFCNEHDEWMEIDISHADVDTVLAAAQHVKKYHDAGGAWNHPCEVCHPVEAAEQCAKNAAEVDAIEEARRKRQANHDELCKSGLSLQ